MGICWYAASIPCPSCKEESALIQSVSYSADGEMRFTRYCETCKETLYWRVFASQLAHRALCKDTENEIKTPAQINPAPGQPEKLTDQDKKLERSMGIDPGEDAE